MWSIDTELLQNHLPLLWIQCISLYFIRPYHDLIESLWFAHIPQPSIVWVDPVLISLFHPDCHTKFISQFVTHNLLFKHLNFSFLCLNLRNQFHFIYNVLLYLLLHHQRIFIMYFDVFNSIFKFFHVLNPKPSPDLQILLQHFLHFEFGLIQLAGKNLNTLIKCLNQSLILIILSFQCLF